MLGQEGGSNSTYPGLRQPIPESYQHQSRQKAAMSNRGRASGYVVPWSRGAGQLSVGHRERHGDSVHISRVYSGEKASTTASGMATQYTFLVYTGNKGSTTMILTN